MYDVFARATGAHIQFGMYIKRIPLLIDQTLIQKNEALALEWEGLKILIVKLHREYTEDRLNREKLVVYQTKYAEVLQKISKMEEELLRLLKQCCKQGVSQHDNPVEWIPTAGTISYIHVPYNEMTHLVDPKDFVVKRNPEYGKIWETSTSRWNLSMRMEVRNATCLFRTGPRRHWWGKRLCGERIT